MLEQIKGMLKTQDIKYKERQSLASLSAIRIGGEARLIVYPKNVEEFKLVLNCLDGRSWEYRVLGRMSNALPPDEPYSRLIIKTDFLRDSRVAGRCMYAEAGAALPALANVAASSSLSGLEELSGIPGSLGGAIFGNAGAFGREISDCLSALTVYSPREKSVLSLSTDELDFGYRNSSIKREKLIVLAAELSLVSAENFDIRQRMGEFLERRRESSPRQPSLGSTFKRPRGAYASKMIDECGLRGFSVGGAAISAKHAGYIVNMGGATAKDVKTLVDVAQDAVEAKFGVRLEREIEYL